MQESLPAGNYWMLLHMSVGYVQEIQKSPDT